MEMAVYEQNSAVNSGHFTLDEQYMYGSSRLGVYNAGKDLTLPANTPINLGSSQSAVLITFERGKKFFELSNHLGNVLVTIRDDKKAVASNNTIAYYTANVVSANDYYPFGMQMPGRKFNAGMYRYGFNGKENDNDVKGQGNQQDYGMRIYDTRLGKFLSGDPLTSKFPFYSPYQYAGNSPIKFIDLDGAEPTSNPGDAQKVINQQRKSLQQSTHFKSISPQALLDNLEANIKEPERLCQGYGTNFCGGAQIATQLISKDPVGYVNLMVDLYNQSSASYNNGSGTINISASDNISGAGNLKYGGKYKGTTDLSSNPADQLLLLGIANSNKDWLNAFSGSYSFDAAKGQGDENGMWASTSFEKFKKMAGANLLGYQINAKGGTLHGGTAGPFSNMSNDEVLNYFNQQLTQGNVTIFRVPWESSFPIPTHFIRIHGIKLAPDKKQFILDQWDYGKRQDVLIDAKIFKENVRGVITFIDP